MGFTIRYRSTRAISAPRAETICNAAAKMSEGRTWLSSEPVNLHLDEEDGRLLGFSKPNFHPHPDDLESAALEGLPDGTIRDVIDVLCEISRDHEVDWEFSHDYSPGPIGFIRRGVCEERLLEQIEGIAGLAEMMGDSDDFPPSSKRRHDDDDGPAILPFRPREG